MAHHTLDRSHTVNRWNRDYPPALTIAPGDTVSLVMRDSSDGQVHPGMTIPEFAAFDKMRVHAITGPVAVDGAEPGDALEIEILDYRETYGYEIRNEKWRGQFTGKQHGARLKLDGDIQNISGATLSCRHITDGVKRLLSLYELVLKR